MHSTTLVKIAICLSLSGAAPAAFATYGGPSDFPVLRTVAEVLQQGKDDDVVLLTGHITKRVGKERFLFKDATGEIRLDIDQEKMPAQAFDEKTSVEISGEVEREFMRSVEIDVTALRILK